MERIVIEVDEGTARKWKNVSHRFKKLLSKRFSSDIEFVLENYGESNFFEALDEIGERLAKRGLTEDIVNEILKSDD